MLHVAGLGNLVCKMVRRPKWLLHLPLVNPCVPRNNLSELHSAESLPTPCFFREITHLIHDDIEASLTGVEVVDTSKRASPNKKKGDMKDSERFVS
jgi:hypothetical protein